MKTRLSLLQLVVPLFFFIGCNKEKRFVPLPSIEIPDSVISNTDTIIIEKELPPITNFGRTCQPKEIIRNTSNISGYTDKESYEPGETVYFYIHSKTPEYSFNLYRFGATETLINSQNRSDGNIQNYLCYAYSWGCDWKMTFSFNLASNLSSGYYSSEVSNSFGSWWITFIVKEPSKSADIALLASNNTWAAYNNWGGGSFYKNFIEEENNFSEDVTFARPNNRSSPRYNTHLGGAELHLIRWLENKNHSFDMYAEQDMHYFPNKFANYKVIIIQVHPEYYTKEMYDVLENHVRTGGNLMYLGGNGVYAKVVYDPTLRRLETRKSGTEHRYENSTGGLWRNLNRPESSLLGVEYDSRGFNTFHAYKVKKESHWIFNNTGLKNGDSFGGNCGRGGASGAETDKITQYSPKNLIHLAKGNNPDDGGADMIYYENNTGGKVFSVGSISYTSCINSDPEISQITENVLIEFLK